LKERESKSPYSNWYILEQRARRFNVPKEEKEGKGEKI
jgi:hypothetical protein